MLILTVGIVGSGKTFWSKEIGKKLNWVRLSSDELRAVIGKGEDDQSVNAEVFSSLRKMVEYFLIAKLNVVLDATNYKKKNRGDFIEIAKRLDVEVKAAVFETPLEECKRRNAARERKVPEWVIDKQFKEWEAPSLEEFDEIFNGNIRTEV